MLDVSSERFLRGSIYHVTVTKKKYLNDAKSNDCFYAKDSFLGEICKSEALIWK